MNDAARVLHWNGRDVPLGLAELPPGDYVVEHLENWNLSAEEVVGLEEAVGAHDRGEGIAAHEVNERLRQRIAGYARR